MFQVSMGNREIVKVLVLLDKAEMLPALPWYKKKTSS